MNRFPVHIRLSLVLIASALCIGAVAGLASASLFWSGSLEKHLPSVALEAGRLPVGITVFGRSSDTISARLTIYNPVGEILGTVERSWSGWELVLDCIVVGTGNGWLVFPYTLYSNESSPDRGVNLLKIYNRNGFPAIWDKGALQQAERKSLSRLFFIVRTERWMPRILGSLHHERVTIRSFEPGIEYSLFAASSGRLEWRPF